MIEARQRLLFGSVSLQQVGPLGTNRQQVDFKPDTADNPALARADHDAVGRYPMQIVTRAITQYQDARHPVANPQSDLGIGQGFDLLAGSWIGLVPVKAQRHGLTQDAPGRVGAAARQQQAAGSQQQGATAGRCNRFLIHQVRQDYCFGARSQKRRSIIVPGFSPLVWASLRQPRYNSAPCSP